MTENVTHTFFIAGVKFHEMPTVIRELEEGMELDLCHEPENPYDPNAVRIVYPAKRTMLGYVPKKFSSEISASLEIGVPIKCVIVNLNPSAKPWEQCKVELVEIEEDE